MFLLRRPPGCRSTGLTKRDRSLSASPTMSHSLLKSGTSGFQRLWQASYQPITLSPTMLRKARCTFLAPMLQLLGQPFNQHVSDSASKITRSFPSAINHQEAAFHAEVSVGKPPTLNASAPEFAPPRRPEIRSPPFVACVPEPRVGVSGWFHTSEPLSLGFRAFRV